MKFRIFVLAILFLSIINRIYSQEEPSFKRHEVGFNATLFVKQILNFSSNSIPFSPYQFTYKYLTKKGVNFRLGSGVSSSKTTETVPKSDPKVTKNYSLHHRLGIEKQSVINKHWKCYYGVDLTYDYSDSKSDFGTSSIRDIGSGFGAGPVLGIQYYINDRLSFYTEASMLYTNITTKTDSNNSANPQQNQSKKLHDISANTILPTTLFFAIKF